MKKWLTVLLVLLLWLSPSFSENLPENGEAGFVPEIRFREESVTLNRGGKQRLEVEILPADASVPGMDWTSSDSSVARVSRDGTVTAHRVGTSVVTCTVRGGSGASASITVNVINGITSLSFRADSVSLMIGEELETALRIRPKDASNRTVLYASSDESVASVTQDGVLRGISAGSCTVTAVAADGGGAQASLPVRVEPILSVRINGIQWKTGEEGARLILTVENLSEQRKIRDFDFRLRCLRDPDTLLALEYLRYSGPNLLPGRSEESQPTQYAIHRAEEADRVEITPIRICFTDGTVLNIPPELQVPVLWDGPGR